MAQYYIATTGNDTTGTGTVGNPWATITKAYNTSAANDTINVAAGTYTGSAGWLPNTFTARVLIGAALVNGLPSVILDRSGTTSPSFGCNCCSSGDTTTIKNIRFTNTVTAGGNSAIFSNNGGATGLLTFENCVFDNMTVTPGLGAVICMSVFVSDSRAVIRACLFYNIQADGSGSAGFIGANGTTVNSSWTIVNCSFNANTAGTPLDHFLQILGGYDVGAYLIKNNIFANNQGTTMYTTAGHGTTLPGAYVFSNNCTYNVTNPLTGSNNITGDPLWVDGSIGSPNYNLRASSPCIDTGILV